MIKLNPTLLKTKLENIPEEKYKEAFGIAIQIKEWLNNKSAYAVASNQLNIPYRMFVAKNYKKYGLPTDIFFNPSYEEFGEKGQYTKINSFERCLSYPGQDFVISRFTHISITYYDPREKKNQVMVLVGLPALVFQHETMHLDGITDEDLAIKGGDTMTPMAPDKESTIVETSNLPP